MAAFRNSCLILSLPILEPTDELIMQEVIIASMTRMSGLDPT